MLRIAKTFVCAIFLLLLVLSPAHGEQREIRILYINDFHGFAEGYKPYGGDEVLGGAAYLAALAETRRREKPSLFVAAGDMIQGSNWTNQFEGASVIELMNAMHFDLMVVGNHEFDFGQEILAKRVCEAHFPVLGTNVEGMEVLRTCLVQKVGDVKVGVIGVVAEDTPVTTHPRNVAGLRFLPPAATVRNYLERMRGQVDVIVILSHLGLNADVQLARDVPDIDVIVGGHSHTRIDTPMRVGKTTIVQAFEHGKVLGVLDLKLDNGKLSEVKGWLEDIRPASMPRMESIAALVEKYQRRVDAAMNEVIGEAEVDLDGVNVRMRDTNLGAFVADVIRRTSGADAAIINGGGIRTSISKGKIRVGDVYAVVPFDNYIVAIQLTGRQIRETLEYGVSAVDERAGRFPQVSGITFRYAGAAKPGMRVRDICIGGKPIDPDGLYAVATIDFLAAGGDGYKTFGDAVRSSKDYAVVGGAMKGERLVYSNSGKWLRDVVVDYVRTAGSISPAADRRIEEIE